MNGLAAISKPFFSGPRLHNRAYLCTAGMTVHSHANQRLLRHAPHAMPNYVAPSCSRPALHRRSGLRLSRLVLTDPRLPYLNAPRHSVKTKQRHACPSMP